MENIVRNLAVTAAFLIGPAVVGLGAYDLIVIQPRLNQVKKFLEDAPNQDASPPPLIRKMIDANSDGPSNYATSMVVGRVYPQSSNLRWHMRNALWRALLPLHIGQSGMYGLYATLSFNGTDHGLTAYASREFGKPLDQLSALQAATTVAITHLPRPYSSDRQRLKRRADALLKKSGLAP
ncbi:hypothetical protein LL974_08180 [Xanthomonas campestris pv. cannae]|nr:hypothetical protein [Xanthomonas campestris pv. cannae]